MDYPNQPTTFEKPEAAAPPTPQVTGGAGDAMGTTMDSLWKDIESRNTQTVQAQKDLATAQGQYGIDAARAEADLSRAHAGQMAGLFQRRQKEIMEKPPENKIEHDTATGFMGLAAMIPIAAAVMGGKGQMSGIGAIQAMTGMVEGYKTGNDQRIAFETKKYEDEMKKFDLHQKQLADAFSVALEQAKYNQTAATANLKLKLAELNAPLLSKMAETQGIVATNDAYIKFQTEFAKQKLTHEEKMENAKRIIVRVPDPSDPTKMISVFANNKGIPISDANGNYVIPEPKAGTTKGQGAAQERNQRVITATSLVAGAVEPLVKLKGGTTTGILPNLSTKDGMFNFLRNKTGRTLSSDESDFMNTTFAGIGRALASIETGGVATGLTLLAQKIENSTYINAGASDIQAANKLAELRDTVHEAVNAGINSGQYNEAQTATLKTLLGRIDAAIPFSRNDVAEALAKRIAPGKGTVGSRAIDAVKGGGSAAPQSSLPSNIPAGYTYVGKAADGSGRNVYQAPDGTLHAQ